MDAEMANSLRPLVINMIDRLGPVDCLDVKNTELINAVANIVQAYAALTNQPVIITADSDGKADLNQFGLLINEEAHGNY